MTPSKLDKRRQNFYPRPGQKIERDKWVHVGAMLEAVAVSTPAVEEMEHPEVALTFRPRTSYPEVLVKTG